MKHFFFLFILTLSFACKQEKNLEAAQNIIDMAIDKACNGHCKYAIIDFTFRGRSYVSTRNGDTYKFERITKDSTSIIREAYNVRIIEGIRFVDYNNYKPESLEVSLTDLDELFKDGTLKLLSKIENEGVGVSY